MDSVQSRPSKPVNSLSAYALIRIDHWRINFCSTGCPPRSETPFTISSFAKTVPSAGHQFTQESAKNVKRYACRIASCSFSLNAFHSAAVKIVSQSEQAFTLAFPFSSNSATNFEMRSALLVVLS